MFRPRFLLAAFLAGLLSPLMTALAGVVNEVRSDPDFGDHETDQATIVTPVSAALEAVLAAGCEAAGCQTVSHSRCDCGQAESCTCEEKHALKKAAAAAYKDPFYNNRFDYLCDPCYDEWHLGEYLKRMGFADLITVDVGGQYRLRQHSERGIRNTAAVPNGLGLTGADDDFLLHRTRLYVNSQIGSRVRFYAEMLDAVSNDEDYRPRIIEENRAELQNLFLDVVVLDPEAWGGKLTARIGRQELLYGSQRLISPLDWANTRRTFEGGKLIWEDENWDLDGFWARPMRRVGHVQHLDPPDLDRQLYGVFSTYKGLPRDKVDAYWLADDNDLAGFRYDTLGGRYYGSYDAWLYELEGGYQFGSNANDSGHSAGFFTLGGGRKFDCVRWKPTLWLFYDWASGGSPLAGPDGIARTGTGFNHYEPLGHKYLGFMDLYARSNIEAVNAQLTLRPLEKLTLLAWYYYFWLQDGSDVPYNVDMTPFAGLSSNPTGNRDLGHEIDLTATYLFTPRLGLLLGYSHFFSGRFYDTSKVPYRGDADFFYTQLTLDF